jgi:transposase
MHLKKRSSPWLVASLPSLDDFLRTHTWITAAMPIYSEWRILRVLLPVERKPGKRARGRPPADNRNVINGILWRLRTGAPWRDVPEKYGKWNSIYRRFRRWSACGVWEAIALAETMAESGHYDIDSTTVRAHVSQRAEKGDSSTSSWPLAGRVHQ